MKKVYEERAITINADYEVVIENGLNYDGGWIKNIWSVEVKDGRVTIKFALEKDVPG